MAQHSDESDGHALAAPDHEIVGDVANYSIDVVDPLLAKMVWSRVKKKDTDE